MPTNETKKRVKLWKKEFNNYISNTPETEIIYMNQDIEIDAYSFALYLLFMECPNADGSVDIGIPPCIEDEVLHRVESQTRGIYRCI